ncbi:helix-turn-helix protein [Anseongella ginsenosidimutans]|uniref:Helix-turn-helix protein n=2 Tax=Anseongella ginsenosidimutans TaxID=496056 RepID=A0A4R3KSM4_9SPHI|nr:helix-turn-helix transcriptional regulator [Anseongella ginsenosidimutans]TCS88208.1 helix-turn-helix protein [Anseongella ginsenosidimutans]
MEEQDGFTVLENKTIGRNLALFRKLRDKKAMEVADYVGIGEAAYTKYERGESKITVDIIQKVAEYLAIDPLQIVSVSPNHFVENVSNSPFAIHGSVQTSNEELNRVMLRLMESVVSVNERLITLLEEKKPKKY